jgi:hypothetical protein
VKTAHPITHPERYFWCLDRSFIRKYLLCNQGVRRDGRPYKQEVRGSSPRPPTINPFAVNERLGPPSLQSLCPQKKGPSLCSLLPEPIFMMQVAEYGSLYNPISDWQTVSVLVGRNLVRHGLRQTGPNDECGLPRL